jgi:hypothetical protein
MNLTIFLIVLRRDKKNCRIIYQMERELRICELNLIFLTLAFRIQ